jgi:hypothetical protein
MYQYSNTHTSVAMVASIVISASVAILDMFREIVCVPVILEYEETMTTPEHCEKRS